MFSGVSRRFDRVMLNFMIEDVRCKLLTHVGSIELQAQLDNDPIILPSIILQEFEEHTQMICLDIYANYVCQKLVSYLSSRQLFRFIEIISCDFELIATSIPGSCVISSLMVVLINDDWCKTSLLKLFEVSICRLICDPQGSHLLQLAINLFEAKDVKFIHQTVKENFFLVATDRFGCCLIKKIIEKTDFIFQLVLDNLYELSNDQFGNYIVQYYFELQKTTECHEIIDKLLPELEQLSKQKYGSNVLEKIIDACDYKRKFIINSLTETEDKVLELAQNRFGNYVLQRCLELVTVGEDKLKLYEKTRSVLHEIQNETIKMRIEDRLQ